MSTRSPLPPHSEDAEKGALGSILREPEDWLDRSCEVLTSADFYLPAHQVIYAAMIALALAGTPIDYLTLTQHLADQGKLEGVGGARAVSDLYAFTPSAANAEHYFATVAEKAQRRALLAACFKTIAEAGDETLEAPDVLAGAEKRFLALGERRSTERQVLSARELAATAGDRYEAIYDGTDEKGFPTGLQTLDSHIGGLFRGELFGIAANEKQGKTALARQIALHLATKQNVPTLFFPLEMAPKPMYDLCACTLAQVEFGKLRKREVSVNDIARLNSASRILHDAPLFFADAAGIDLPELARISRRYVQRENVKVIIIDYLQLLSRRSQRGNRADEVSAVSAECKELATRLNVAVVLVAQLNENGTVLDSRGLQRDCDGLVGISHESGESPVQGGLVRIRVMRARYGENRSFCFRWNGAHTSFERWTGPEPEESAPESKPQRKRYA